MRLVRTKKMIPWLLLLGEIVLVIGFYFFGRHGYRQLCLMRAENDALLQQMQHTKQEIQALEHHIADWQKYPFYTEQVAREQLQMMQPGDEIYYLE